MKEKNGIIDYIHPPHTEHAKHTHTHTSMHSCVNIGYGPWHKENPALYSYDTVIDEGEMEKYNTAKKLLMRMDRRLNNAYRLVDKYSLTPLPVSFQNALVDGRPASIYDVLKEWTYDEAYLRRGNFIRHPLTLCGTPEYEHDRQMQMISNRVILDLHIYCSCAARIITNAVRRHDEQLKACRQ